MGAGVLLGAILAPAEPVLATDVQVRHPGDRDQLRFNLTCEAGMNDGSAFPFVVLGLGLIGVVYGVSVLAHAWGFLAVRFAAVALRQTELKQSRAQPWQGNGVAATAADATGGPAPADQLAAPMVSMGSLVFKEHLERLSELALVPLLGGAMFMDSWSWHAVAMALFLFVVARPLSVFFVLWRGKMPLRTQGMIGWFGVRGIGSLYYLMYAIQHGLPEPVALQLIQMTLSILLHGISVKPLMAAVWQRGRT